MTDNIQELDVILGFIENYGVSASCDGFDPHKSRSQAKQALLDWHNKRELEARIDTLEYAKISPKFKIEKKIEQLRLELKKYEQTNDKDS